MSRLAAALVVFMGAVALALTLMGRDKLPAWQGVAMDHLLRGDYHGPDNVSGFHLAGANGYPGGCPAEAGTCDRGACCGDGCNARADGARRPKKPWQARVYLRRSCRTAWVEKPEGSTMFPVTWDRETLRRAVRTAYKKGGPLPGRPDRWCGCARGLTIGGYHDEGYVTTAWPSLEPGCHC